jgi:hypothetical protein
VVHLDKVENIYKTLIMKKYQKGGGVTNPGASDRRGVRPKLTEEERRKKEVEARKKKAESLGTGAIPSSRRTKRYDELSVEERKKREIEARKKRSKEFGKGVKMKENTRPGRMQKGGSVTKWTRRNKNY